MFDAGAIIASLDIEQKKFDDALRKAEARIRAFENEPHKVQLTAEFSSSSLPRARKFYADLDKAITSDAIQRSKSGNGSVLASMMGLTSSHQITGMPTGQQAARGGVIGQIMKTPVTAVTGTTTTATVGSALAATTAQSGSAGSTAGKSFGEHFKNALGKAGIGGFIGAMLGGGAAASAAGRNDGALLTKALLASIGGMSAGGARVGTAGALDKGVLGGIGPGMLGLGAKGAGLIGGIGSLLGAVPAVGAIGAAAGVAGLGIGALGAVSKGITSQLAPYTSVYQQLQVQKSLAVTAAQQKAVLVKQAQLNQAVSQLSPAMQTIYNAQNKIADQWQKFTGSMAVPLAKVWAQLPGLISSLFPMFKAAIAFAQPLLSGLTIMAKDIVPVLVQGFKAAAPLLLPLLSGLGMLVHNLLAGMIPLLKAAMPAVVAFAQVLGTLGKDLGTMFAQFAPVIKQSAVIFKALMDVLSAIFPIVGALAAVFAKALAPVFVLFASVVKSLLPVLVIIGKVLASLAGAVLGALVSAFSALAILIKGIAPSLTILANTLSSVFTVMENAGVFAILGNALEKTAPLLAQLINALVVGLAPILPPVIGLISALAGIAIKLLVQGIQILVPIALQLIHDVLRPLIPAIQTLIPIITIMAKLLATGLGDVLTAIAPILAKLAPIILAIVLAVKAWAIAQAILDIALNANPIGLITIAIAALVIGIVELVKHWRSIWAEVQKIAKAAWDFIYNGFGKFLLPLLGPVGLIALAAIEMYKHWAQIMGLVRTAAHNLWTWLWTDFGQKILNFFTQTIPHWWDVFYQNTVTRLVNPFKNVISGVWNWLTGTFGANIARLFTSTIPGYFRTAVTAVGTAWTAVENAVKVPVQWVVNNVINRLISAFDWISSKVGGPNIKPFRFGGGGSVPGYGGGDKWPALLEGGEVIVPKEKAGPLGWLWQQLGIPGYQKGGTPGQPRAGGGPAGQAPPAGAGSGILSGIWDVIKGGASVLSALATGNTAALTNDFVKLLGKGTGGAVADMATLLTNIPATLVKDAIHTLMGFFGGASANGIVNYALSFLGKIPYVWGGTAVPGGADCSGFVQAVYEHFGIGAPRTSEAQGGWVRRGPPVPGGLAFYHSPAGGADPGHVAIIRNASSVISQGGGMGPTLMSMNAMPLLWTGTPPGGFGKAGSPGGISPGHVPGNVQSWLLAAMAATGAPRSWLGDLEWIQQHETDNLANMLTVVNPNGGATGLMQVKPGTFAQFATVGGGIFNPVANAVAAIRHIMSAWIVPSNIPGIGTGSYHGYDKGGWMIGGLNQTGQPEAVLTPAESRAFVAQYSGTAHSLSDVVARLDALIAVTGRNPHAMAQGVTAALGGAARGATYRAMYGSR